MAPTPSKKLAKFFSFSKESRSYLILASVLTILLVALVLAKRQREAFNANNNSMTLPADWKGPKTPILTREGIHTFFTDGSMLQSPQFLESRVLFTPTNRDTQCYLTNAPHSSFNCTHIPLEEFASVDSTSATPAIYTCNSIDSIRPMHNANDDSVRILNCEYNFHKECLQLHNTVLNSTRDFVTLDLPVNKLSTSLFILSRPVFVKSINSVMYKVSYMSTDYAGVENSIVNYDNKSKTQNVRVLLRPVSGQFNGKMFTLSQGTSSIIDDAVASDAAIAELTNISSAPTRPQRNDRVLSPILPITMFYLRPKKSVADDIPLTEAFSVYFTSVDTGAQRLSKTLFNNTINITTSRSSQSSTNCTIQVRRENSLAELTNVPRTSSLLVTYSVNCLTIVAMDIKTGAIRMRRFPSFLPVLSVADPTALLRAINAANARLPHPLISLSIPSPIDIARLVNMPLGA